MCVHVSACVSLIGDVLDLVYRPLLIHCGPAVTWSLSRLCVSVCVCARMCVCVCVCVWCVSELQLEYKSVCGRESIFV